MHVIHQNVLIFSNITDYPTLYLESKNLYMVKKRGSWISTNACVFLNLIFRGAYPTTQGGRFLVRIRTWVTWITGNHQPGAWKNHRQHQQLLPLVSNKGSCFGQGPCFWWNGPPKSPPFSRFIRGIFFDLTAQQFATPWVLILPWGYHKPTDMSARDGHVPSFIYHHFGRLILGIRRFCSKRSSTCFVVSQFAERQWGFLRMVRCKVFRTKNTFFFCVKINATLTQAELPWDLVNIISTYL